MERREILYVVLAVMVVIMGMGVMSMARGDKTESSTEQEFIPPQTAASTTTTKSVWDEIRDLQETTTSATDGTEMSMPVSTDTADTASTTISTNTLPEGVSLITGATITDMAVAPVVTTAATTAAENPFTTAMTAPGITIVFE